jgi:riboflavin transporter FmnP
MKKIIITSETPLSALIREAHHQELATIIEKWRPFLKVDCSNVDVLKLSYFEFDFDRINIGTIYRHLAQLIILDAVITSMSELARYIVGHSNLKTKWESVYRQVNRYFHFFY